MKKTMIIASITIGAILLISISFMAYNRIIPISLGIHKPVYHTNNIALDGYDVTTYFKDKLMKGVTTFSFNFNDVTWYFASENNLDEFKNNTDKYLPQYGGYCSKAVSTGFAAPADPSIFTIYNGKLYIFSSMEVKDEFSKDPNSVITSCNSKWK